MLTELKRLESGADKAESVHQDADHRDPGLYNDPWTHETLMRFRERHQDPKSTDIEYAARINNLDGVDGFIEGAFRLALVRLDGGLRRRPAVPLPDGRAQAADRGAEISAARAPTRRS